MGALCVCANDTDRLKNLSSEERGNIGGDKIHKSNYIGRLFTLSRVEKVNGSTDLDFKAPTGQYSHFYVSAKIVQQDKGPELLVPKTSEDGGIILGPNCKIDLRMYIVQKLFVDDKVVLRVRLEIEGSTRGSCDQIAQLQVLSKIGVGMTQVYKELPVYGHT